MADEQAATMTEAPADQLGSLSHEQHHDWLLTGKLPEAKKEASPSSPAAETPEADTPEVDAAESETAKTPEIETRRAKTERRFKELLADQQKLKAEIAELRAGKAAETKTAPAAESQPPEKSTAKSKLQEKIDAINANDSKYSTYEEKVIAIAEAVADDRFEQRDAAHQRQSEATERTKRLDVSKEAARSAHKDFDDVIKDLGKADVVAPGSVIEAWILDSDVGGELMYYFGQNREELDKIKSMNPFAQSRALTRLEDKFTSQSAPVKTETKAPPAPRELGSGATAPKDDLEAAVKDGDAGRYIQEANRRDRERSRRG